MGKNISKMDPSGVTVQVTHVRWLGYFGVGLEARIVIDSTTVKYVQIVGLVDVDMDRVDAQKLLPPLPAGDWNYGFVKIIAGKPYFGTTEVRQFPSLCEKWCRTVDYSQLDFEGSGGPFNHFPNKEMVFQARVPSITTDKVVVKMALFPPNRQTCSGYDHTDELKHETNIYRRIHGHNVGPKVLGLLTENQDRVVGIVMEKIDGQPVIEEEDIPACNEQLDQLHALGIAHCDAHRGNFIKGPAGPVIIDFGYAKELAPRGGDACFDKATLKASIRMAQEAMAVNQGVWKV